MSDFVHVPVSGSAFAWPNRTVEDASGKVELLLRVSPLDHLCFEATDCQVEEEETYIEDTHFDCCFLLI
jgi:hypothetical protein